MLKLVDYNVNYSEYCKTVATCKQEFRGRVSNWSTFSKHTAASKSNLGLLLEERLDPINTNHHLYQQFCYQENQASGVHMIKSELVAVCLYRPYRQLDTLPHTVFL